jgi:predicted phage-related endonuclease
MSEDLIRFSKIGAVQSDRRHFIGGSDARIIMGDDEAALLRLWREKRGEVEPEDLSGNLIVQLGQATEDLNRLWYERNTGQAVKDVQRRVQRSPQDRRSKRRRQNISRCGVPQSLL